MKESLPVWGRGLKSLTERGPNCKKWSLPVWGRGLKFVKSAGSIAFVLSLPVWGRGLKYILRRQLNLVVTVAPCMGAWIEMDLLGLNTSALFSSLPVWGRGLKSEH